MITISFKRSLQFLSALLIIGAAQASTQDRWFISPGFKLGYAFGENGGVVVGAEVSITHWPESGRVITGACVSIEGMKPYTLLHVGFEAASVVGASVGPTMLISKESRSWGFTGTIWGALVVLPYFRYSSFSSTSDLYEAGTFLKFPMMLSGPRLSLGG